MPEILFFELDEGRYGLVSSDVVEVTRAVKIVALPMAPPMVEGFINVRGTIVAALDIRKRFGLRPRRLSPSDYMIMATIGRRTVAIRVDRVTNLASVPMLDVDDARAIVAPAGAGATELPGVVKLPDGLALIHDLRTFLSADDATALDAAVASARREAESPG